MLLYPSCLPPLKAQVILLQCYELSTGQVHVRKYSYNAQMHISTASKQLLSAEEKSAWVSIASARHSSGNAAGRNAEVDALAQQQCQADVSTL